MLPDGTVKQVKAYAPQASLRLANVYPNEPEAMAMLSSYEFAKDRVYVVGPDGSVSVLVLK